MRVGKPAARTLRGWGREQGAANTTKQRQLQRARRWDTISEAGVRAWQARDGDTSRVGTEAGLFFGGDESGHSGGNRGGG